jgi:hypothetical protein
MSLSNIRWTFWQKQKWNSGFIRVRVFLRSSAGWRYQLRRFRIRMQRRRRQRHRRLRQQSVVNQIQVGQATIESSRRTPSFAIDGQADQSRRRRRSPAYVVSRDAASSSLRRDRLLPSSPNLRLAQRTKWVIRLISRRYSEVDMRRRRNAYVKPAARWSSIWQIAKRRFIIR